MPSAYDCYAISAPGIESITAAELAGLKLTPRSPEPGGIAFEATPARLYAANLHLRTASRVLVRVAEFGARTFFELERHARKIPWERFVAPGGAVAFRVTSRKSKLYHDGAIEERLLRWAGEAGYSGEGRKEKGERENEPEMAAELPLLSSPFSFPQLFLVRLHRDRVTVSVDSSGELLHRRGYRQQAGKAPLRETLAAAMLLSSGWDGAGPLVDPFCGSGTIPIEAALLARNIASGIKRSFAFERWPEFETEAWRAVKEQAVNGERPTVNGKIEGFDRDAGAITASRANAERAGVAGDIEFTEQPLSALRPSSSATNGWLLTNPPYGVRIGEEAKLRDLYASLGSVTRERLPGWTVGLLGANPALEGQIGLPLQSRFETENGGIKVRFVVGGCEVRGARFEVRGVRFEV